IVAVALVLLVQSHGTPWLAIPSAVIVGREIVISALREWMAELGKRRAVAVNTLGKIKTIGQMVAIFLLLSVPPKSVSLISILGYVLIYAAALFTLWSMLLYLRAAREELIKPSLP